MRAGWFDLANLDNLQRGQVDNAGIAESVEYVSSLIEKEVAAGIPHNRIVVGGFSQVSGG